MIPLSAARISALLHRYGRRAELRGDGADDNRQAHAMRLLINATRPHIHPDLPADSVLADGLALSGSAEPVRGDVIQFDGALWQVRSAVALDADRTLFELQLSQAVEAAP